MNIILKCFIIISITILVVLLISYDIYKGRSAPSIEEFSEFQTTIITGFSPKEGDSSTIVTIKGKGLGYIQEVLFNDVESVILEERTDQKIKIIPPAMSELGISIEEVRKTINETGSGIPVNIKILKKDGGKTPDTAVLLPKVKFFYVDKGMNWQNQCPKEEVEEINIEPPSIGPDIETDEKETEAEFKEGTDLYFLHVTLPAMEFSTGIIANSTVLSETDDRVFSKVKHGYVLYDL